MSKTTKDGLTIYDLDPNASELWAVAGPAGYDVSKINPERLPEGFRWIDSDEWADSQPLSVSQIYDVLSEIGETGSAEVRGSDLFTRREENCDWQFTGTVEDGDDAKQAIQDFYNN